MTYIVCKTNRCRQTYHKDLFTVESRDVKCDKCGGEVIGKNGEVMLSRNAAVIPVISIEEIEAQKKATIKHKRDEIKRLQREIKYIENEEDEL